PGDPATRQDGNALEPGPLVPLAVTRATAFEKIDKRKLISDRKTLLEGPMHVSQIEVDGRTAGIPGHEATFFEKGADGPHAGSSGHIAYLGHGLSAHR